jgi:lipopolysaccharide export LptBFGC system permease protein LptF
VFICVKKKETAFVISFISSSVSFGYVLLNSVFQAFIDRYNFPVYISTWIAIVALGCGIYRIMFMKNVQDRVIMKERKFQP